MQRPFLYSILFFLLLTGLYVMVMVTRPMPVAAANGLNYVQFLSERYHAAQALSDGCQALHLVTFLTLPPTATLYTLAGVFPDSALAQQISPSDRWRFKSRVPILSAPRAWWDQLERMSWFALTQGRSGTPECNLGRVDFR